MNTERTTCKPEQIHAFFSEKLPPNELCELESHLSVCELCQSRFETGLAQYSDVIDRVESIRTSGLDTLELHKRNIRSKDSLGEHGWNVDLVKRFLPPSPNPDALGKLGEFDLVELLGAGGMGLVFKAWDGELHRHVAMKVLAPHYSLLGASKKRFLREAQTAASIVSPYVVPIHAVATENDIPYLVMSYVPGCNFEERLQLEGTLTPLETLRIAHQIAMGLAAAHERGLVHRDVKPGNVLLERGTSRVWLTDFGLAQAADSASLTHSGLIAGTPCYMSPEQARGETVDHRSDLYSLGGVMYTMVVGHPPFRAPTAYAVIKRIIEDEPRSLRSHSPEIPAWFDRLVMKLLAKEPSDRFSSSKEVAEVLAMCEMHCENPVQHPVPDVLKESRSPPRQSRLRRWAGLVTLSVLASGGILYGLTQLPDRFSSDLGRVQLNPTTGEPRSSTQNRASLFVWEDEAHGREEIFRIQERIERLESGGGTTEYTEDTEKRNW